MVLFIANIVSVITLELPPPVGNPKYLSGPVVWVEQLPNTYSIHTYSRQRRQNKRD